MKENLCSIISRAAVCCYPWDPPAYNVEWRPFQHTCRYYSPNAEEDSWKSDLNTCSHSNMDWICSDPSAVRDAQLDKKLEEL